MEKMVDENGTNEKRERVLHAVASLALSLSKLSTLDLLQEQIKQSNNEARE